MTIEAATEDMLRTCPYANWELLAVYGDWLEENGHPVAAAGVRHSVSKKTNYPVWYKIADGRYGPSHWWLCGIVNHVHRRLKNHDPRLPASTRYATIREAFEDLGQAVQ